MGNPINVDALRHEIDARGWTQRELARIAGLTESTVSAAFQGKPISAKTRSKLTIAFERHPAPEVGARLAS